MGRMLSVRCLRISHDSTCALSFRFGFDFYGPLYICVLVSDKLSSYSGARAGSPCGCLLIHRASQPVCLNFCLDVAIQHEYRIHHKPMLLDRMCSYCLPSS